MEDRLEQLVQLAKVLDNGYETLQHQIEQAIPRRPVPSEKAALANQAVGSPGSPFGRVCWALSQLPSRWPYKGRKRVLAK
jgi:hypothetical protein